MIARILPASEWSRLDTLGMADVWPTWNPEDVRVCVVENDDGLILDHWIAIRFWHVEGLQVHHPQAFRRLWRLMADTLHSLGVSVVWTGATKDDAIIPGIVTRMGGKEVPITNFVVPVSMPNRRGV
jgi:hypothetical protein